MASMLGCVSELSSALAAPKGAADRLVAACRPVQKILEKSGGAPLTPEVWSEFVAALTAADASDATLPDSPQMHQPIH
ncbi:MAG TPA: hypothetical protein VGI40_22135 [Pirellulaceae bacterium]